MGFAQQIGLTVLGFFLTYVVGSWLTSAWQIRNWRYQKESDIIKERISLQIELVEELGNLIGKRLSRMQRLLSAIRGGDSESIENSWNANDKVVLDWNDNISGTSTKLRQHFSFEDQIYFESYILKFFSEIQEKIYREYRKENADNNNIENIQNNLYMLRRQTNIFIKDLWDEIDKTKASFDGVVDISIENLEKLSYLFLIKSLFKARSNP
jgi:hypothetical protein